jgi:hypothetical protein
MRGLKVLLVLVSIGVAAATISHAAGADTLYQSATLGPGGQVGGFALFEPVGVRFQLGGTAIANQIGGHFIGYSGNT